MATTAENYIRKTVAAANKIVLADGSQTNAETNTNGETTLSGCTIAYFPISFEDVTIQELEQLQEDEIVVRGFTRIHQPSSLVMKLDHLNSETLLHLADYLSKIPQS